MERLLRIMKPPTQPLARDIDWGDVEARHKIVVPDDFRLLLSKYGSGAIDGFAWLLNPASNNRSLNFDAAEYFIAAYADLKASFPEYYPRPSYPKPGSFYPWAVTDNGDTFFWIVNGAPNTWNVGIHSSNQHMEETYEMGAVAFLEALLTREIRSRILPDEFPSENLHFQPSRSTSSHQP